MTVDPAQLTRDLGGNWRGRYGTCPCPNCQTERRRDQNALTVATDGERLLLHCKKLNCDFRDILVAAGVQPGTVEIDQAAKADQDRKNREFEAKMLERAKSIWERSRPIQGTHGETYLRSRGIACPLSESLRWCPDLYHKDTGRYVSAMVARIRGGAVHRTFFTKQGVRLDKATGTTHHKMTLGAISGGHVMLTEAVQGPLVVGEGIESSLSLACGLLDGLATIWASLSTSGMRSLRLPDRSGELIIATDRDKNRAGEMAGNDLAARASGLGWSVSLLPTPEGFGDWNDVLVQKGVAA